MENTLHLSIPMMRAGRGEPYVDGSLQLHEAAHQRAHTQLHAPLETGMRGRTWEGLRLPRACSECWSRNRLGRSRARVDGLTSSKLTRPTPPAAPVLPTCKLVERKSRAPARGSSW